MVRPGSGDRRLRTEADRAESTAAGRDAMAAIRDADHEGAVTTNERRSMRRDALLTGAENDRAAVAQRREWRDELVESMTTEEVASADQGRDALLEDQTRELHLARKHGQRLRALERFRAPSIEASGPGIEA